MHNDRIVPDPAPLPAFGHALSNYLGGTITAGIAARSPGHHVLAVDHVQTATGEVCETAIVPPQDAFHVVLQLQDMLPHELWLDGRLIRTDPYPRHTVSIIDLSQSSRTRIASAHEALVFYLDRSALDEIASEFGSPRIGGLRLPPGVPALDPVMARLGAGLLPQLAGDLSGRLLADQFLLLVQAHVVTAYGAAKLVTLTKGGLAPWQERRAKEMLDGAMSRQTSLTELAHAVSLSPSHFARSFRHSTGMTPHAWLTARRMEAAQAMLLAGEGAIATVAHAVGYAEQSSFAKAFQRHAGLSPSAWARLNRR